MKINLIFVLVLFCLLCGCENISSPKTYTSLDGKKWILIRETSEQIVFKDGSKGFSAYFVERKNGKR